MTVEEFRHHAHLKPGSPVDHETGNRALAGILKQYQRRDLLEAEIKLEAQPYSLATHRTDYRFSANKGPVVKVLVEGVGLSAERIRHIVPIFEEGAVDDDLLNEGNRRLRDYFQREGYFDVRIEHERRTAQSGELTIVYRVQLGQRRSVRRVSVAGNRYFPAGPLQDLLSVHAADSIDRQSVQPVTGGF
jgi:outer membrane protein assembly factor BamA